MTAAFILTTYNRRDITLKCIKQLQELANNTDFSADYFVLDDKSSDGTLEAVVAAFPDVHITSGTGSMFWNRGMFLSWFAALQGDYDAYIWVNDDNILYDYALKELIICAEESKYEAIICGSFCSKDGEFTYGGLDKSFSKVIPNGTMHPIHYMNGNFVFIPRYVVEKIGIIDPAFVQIKGDYDYGLTAIENGIQILSTTRYIGVCPRNPIGNSRGRIMGRSAKRRVYDSFHSPFLENPILSMYFNIKHGKSVFISLLILIKAIIVDCIPDGLYKRLH